MIRSHAIEPQNRGKKMTVLYAVITAVHCVLIFFPLWYWELRMPKQKVNLFRVKIGPAELSSGPVVGPPERARQPLAKPAPPEPEIAKPAPKPLPEPKTVPVKPKAKPVQEPKIVKKKTVPKRAVKEPKIAKSKPPKATPKKKEKKPVKPKRDPDDGVFQESSVMSPKTPVGTRNAAQTQGRKFDGKAPGGGADADMAKFGKDVERYIYLRWKQPSQSHIGDTRPETVVEFVVAPSGRVLSARIVTPSSNPAMEESVKALLATLDILPRPPYLPGQKNFEFQLVLKTK